MCKRIFDFIIASVLTFAMLSCSGDEATQPGKVDTEKIVVTLDATATASSDYLDMSVLTLAVGQLLPGLGKGATPPETLRVLTCPLIVYDRSIRSVTLDFGNGCQGHDGITRSGSITVSYSGSLKSSAAFNLTFNNFSANGLTYAGETVITVSSGAVKLELKNATVTNSKGETTLINAMLAVKATVGKPLDFSDDVYLVGGSLSVTDKDGKSYSLTITEELEITLTCAYPRKGKMEGTTADNVAVKVDFFPANGGCDDLALLTIGSVTREIHLGS